MRCDEARPLASAAIDGALATLEREQLERHVASCAACRAHAADMHRLRRSVRFESLGEVPDVAPRVIAAVASPQRAVRGGDRRRWRSLAPVAAAFVVAAVIGASLVGPPTRPAEVFAADLHDEVFAAQREVDRLRADVAIVEHGWHPAVPARSYRGTLRYRAPESLALHLEDTTTYPSEAWPRNDVDVVVDRERAWSRGHGRCPADAQPACSGREPIPRALTGREPFADDGAPLDLIVPVRSFDVADDAVPRTDNIEGREALVVETTVAQLAPLLDALLEVGNWRELHPADAARLWLDADLLVPLRVEVRAVSSEGREAWAVRRGYDDASDDVLLEVTFTGIDVDSPVGDGAFPQAPADAVTRDAGFRCCRRFDDVGIRSPQNVGLRPYTDGMVGETRIWAWSDGRAWVKVERSVTWAGTRLYGDLGDFVREVPTDRGDAYVGTSGRRVGVHTSDGDYVISGSLATTDLLNVVEVLPAGVRGVRVPPTWAEAANADVAAARRTVRGLLLPRVNGFDAPALRLDGGAVLARYDGGGERAFTLVQSRGDVLAPTLDVIDVEGVLVRGSAGRYSAPRGELEWVEGGSVFALRSDSLALDALLEVAATLAPA